MKLVTARQMTELEQIAIQTYGIDGLLLMENAARGFCDVLESEFGSAFQKNIAVFCGKGNNGGDGFAISRHLYNRGAEVTVVAGFNPKDLKQDAKKNYDILCRMEIPVASLEEIAEKSYDIVIDALLGTGFSGEVRPAMAELIQAINSNNGKVMSVDVPSGADCSNGRVSSCCVRADVTVSFGLLKLGHFLYPAKEYCGKVALTDISLPKNLLSKFPADCFSLDASLASSLPKRKENSHKGSFGKVLVFAGSTGMSGAALMATTAVLKTGAGMVTAAVPDTICDVFATRFPEAMTLPLVTENGALSGSAADIICEKLKSQDVLLAGCGLGTSESAQKALLAVLDTCEKPTVIDADGINALSGHIHKVKNKTVPAVLTPHPLEFSRISGLSVDTIQQNRVQVARNFAKEFGVVLVLKGADTVVAHPDGEVYISPISNSGLAKAGSGDVLAGIIAALLAQGVSPKDGANLGVYIHSLAGIAVRKRLGAYSMTASDVLAALPETLITLAQTEQE